MRNNIDRFVQYFEDGCKVIHDDYVGMELEHFVVKKKDLTMVGYSGERGIEALLERLLPYFPEKNVQDGHLIALGNEEYAISIEPAAQIEVSIVPKNCIKDIEEIYNGFLDVINPILEEWDYMLICAGYCPNDSVKELELIPKKRYEYMNEYFAQIGMYGQCMMRGTASVQVSVDYVSEEDFVRTYRTAVALGPMLSLLMDNVKVFEKKPWNKHLARSYIWERVDKKRCLVVPGTFEDDFGFRVYGEYLCNVSPIFMEENGELIFTGEKMFHEYMKEKGMSVRDITGRQMEHMISMVFPDVRLKQYIEIRVADSVPIQYALGYVAFIKCIFKNRDKMYELYKQFKQSKQLKEFKQNKQLKQLEEFEQLQQFKNSTRLCEEDVQDAKESLITCGWNGEIYGKSVVFWMDRLVELVMDMADEEDKSYLEPILTLIRERKSVKDVITN